MVEEINEIAVIFKRKQSEYDLVEEFVPFKIVAGYYSEEGECFVDEEQNVYAHMASLAEIGNVYAGRVSIYEALKGSNNLTLEELKKRLLEVQKKYAFYKNIDAGSDEYCKIKVRDKETGELYLYSDKETATYYEMYSDLASESTKADLEEEIKVKDETDNKMDFKSQRPIDVVNTIKKTIKGQDKALEAITTLLWIRNNYPQIPKSNLLLIGPTGVGKTAIFRKIEKLYDIPVTEYTITGNSQTGYEGHSVEEMLSQLYYASGKDIDKTEHGIIIIDEFDKIGDNRKSGDVGTVAVQYELLKLIEGCVRQVSLDRHHIVNIDTSNILFVCCGAFTRLYDDKTDSIKTIGFASTTPESKKTNIKITSEDIIQKGGIIRELVGRLPIIVELYDINKDRSILKDILLNSDESIFNHHLELLNCEGIKVDNQADVVDYIIEDAIKRNVGARGLAASTENIFKKIEYSIANNRGQYGSVIIGSNILADETDFELFPKKVKKRIKKIEHTN